MKHCKDNQKIKEAINKLINKFQGISDYESGYVDALCDIRRKLGLDK